MLRLHVANELRTKLAEYQSKN